MAKTTIDGVPQVELPELEYVLGGGSGKLKKVPTKALKTLCCVGATTPSILDSIKVTGETSGTFIDGGVLTLHIPSGGSVESPISKVPNTQNFWLDNSLHMEHTGNHEFIGDVNFKGRVTGLPTGSGGFIQCKELIDMVTLAPTGTSLPNAFTPMKSVLMMTLITEADGTPAVRYDLTVNGDIMLGNKAGSGKLKTLNLKLKGLMGDGAQYAFVDSIQFTGITQDPTQAQFFEYRTNYLKDRTNALQFYVVGSVSGVFIARCQFKVSFVIPNTDKGVGVPFPEVGTFESKKHKVFTE